MGDVPRITPIETHHNGFRFRSRLEARWAVFMETVGLRYEYEPEGYDMGGLWYLPDFWVPDLAAWIEVKGPSVTPGDEAWEKAYRLAEGTESTVYLFTGQFPATPGNLMGLEFSPYGRLAADAELPREVWWVPCPVCGRIQPGPRVWDLPCGCLVRRHPDDSPDVERAVVTARQARFERGG